MEEGELLCKNILYFDKELKFYNKLIIINKIDAINYNTLKYQRMFVNSKNFELVLSF